MLTIILLDNAGILKGDKSKKSTSTAASTVHLATGPPIANTTHPGLYGLPGVG